MKWKKYLNRKALSSYSYILVGYLNVIFNILLSLFLMQKLNAADFGKISIGRTIFQSFEFSHAGIRYGFDRSLPITVDIDQKLQLFWTGLFSTAGFSLLFVLFWSVFYEVHLIFYSFFIFSGFLYAIVQIYRVYYRAEANKNSFIKLSLFSLLLPTTLQIICFLLWGINGFLISFLSSYILIMVLLANLYKVKFASPKSSMKANTKLLLSQGGILFFTSLMAFLVFSGDRILVERFGGMKMVGEYSIIMFVFATLSIFPVNYTELIMSDIIKKKSLIYVFKNIGILVIITTTLCFISILLIPVVFKIFLPQYLYLEFYMDIVIWAAIPYSTISLLNYYLHATDKRIYILLTNIISTALYFLVLYNVLNSSKNMVYILYAKLAYFILNFVLLSTFSILSKNKVRTDS